MAQFVDLVTSVRHKIKSTGIDTKERGRERERKKVRERIGQKWGCVVTVDA